MALDVNFNGSLGIRALGDGGAIEMEARAPAHEAAPGIVHMAVLTTLGEVAAARAVGEAVVPVALSVQFLAPAPPGNLRAEGSLLRRGRRLCAAEGEVFAGGILVAKVSVTFCKTLESRA